MEYTSGFQLEIFNLDIRSLMEPVIDVRCGKNYNLMKFLQDKGIEAYGIDRICSSKKNIYKKSTGLILSISRMHGELFFQIFRFQIIL